MSVIIPFGFADMSMSVERADSISSFLSYKQIPYLSGICRTSGSAMYRPYHISLIQILRKLMALLGSPCICRRMGPLPCFSVRGKPIYSVVPRISV